MNYQLITVADTFTNEVSYHIMVKTGPDDFKTFSATEDNPEYMAWVAKGNPTVQDLLEG